MSCACPLPAQSLEAWKRAQAAYQSTQVRVHQTRQIYEDIESQLETLASAMQQAESASAKAQVVHRVSH